MTEEKETPTAEELEDLKLLQHNMALEGQHISMEELLEMKKRSKADGDGERIAGVVRRAKAEGLSQLEAARRYFFKEEQTSDE